MSDRRAIAAAELEGLAERARERFGRSAAEPEWLRRAIKLLIERYGGGSTLEAIPLAEIDAALWDARAPGEGSG